MTFLISGLQNFSLMRPGLICMKLEAEYEELSRNAVNLNSGSLYLYDDEEEVEILKDAVLTY